MDYLPIFLRIAGQQVLVVGGGDSAVLSALDLVKKSSSVHLSIRSSEYKARPDLVELVEKNAKINVIKNSLPLALEGDDRLRSVSLQVGGRVTNVDCEKMVVKIGYLMKHIIHQTICFLYTKIRSLKNYSIGVKVPESKFILPFPYFFDNLLARVVSCFSNSTSLFFNKTSSSFNLILLIIKVPKLRVN